MKQFFYSVIFLGMILMSGNAFGTTFVDQVDNLVGARYLSVDNLDYNRDTSGVSGLLWEDFIGAGFDTSQVIINQSANGLDVSIFTKFKGFETIGTADLELADFFITNNSGSVYGVDLSWNGTAVYSEGIYSLGTDENYITSQDVFSSNIGYQFAGFYDIDGDGIGPSNGTWKKINVDFDQSAANEIGKIVVSTETTADSSYIYSFAIDSAIANSMDLSNGYSFLFATAECGNDVIHGEVPEPSTLLLLGFGLLGIGALGRRKTDI